MMLGPDEIYLDHSSARPLLPEVVTSLQDALARDPVNPASPHHAGRRSAREVRRTREDLAKALDTEPGALTFTSGGTEANHLGIRGQLEPGRVHHVVVSAIEHASVLAVASALEREGHRVTRVAPGADGVVDASVLLAAVEPDTSLVAMMAANHETGVVQPLHELAAPLRERGVPLHVDAVAVLGRAALRAEDLGATTFAVSGHKVGAPAGIGALWSRPGRRLRPWIEGGHQERGRRGGSVNWLGIVGLGAAVRALPRLLAEAPVVERDRDELESRLLALPDVQRNGAARPRLPHLLNLAFAGVDAGRLVDRMSREGVHASTGSACYAGASEPSPVLTAMGLPLARVRASVRFSLGPPLGELERERVASVVARALASLRRGSL